VGTRRTHAHHHTAAVRYISLPREIIIAGPNFRKLHPPLGSAKSINVIFSKYLFSRVSRRYNNNNNNAKTKTPADPNESL